MKKLRIAVALAVSVCALMAMPAVSAAATPGNVSGKVTDASNGSSIASIQVCAYRAPIQEFGGCDYTDSSGEYLIENLTAGSYKVEFHSSYSETSGEYVTQWYNGKSSFETADAVAVTEGGTTAGVNAAMYQRGRISGTVTDAGNGTPITGIEVCVSLASENNIYGYYYACTKTNASGQYTTSNLEAGSYKVEFRSSYKYNESLEKEELEGPNYVTQYYSGQARPESAGLVSVSDGNTTSGINAAMQPGATITGSVTDAVTGANLQGISVCAWGAAEYRCSWTDTAGNYAIPTLSAGSYKVEFTPEYFFNKTAYKEGKRVWVRGEYPLMDYVRQYWNNKATFEASEAVTAAAGATASGINAKMAKEVQPPPPPPAAGVAIVGAKAKVKGGKALLQVKCKGAGACKGSIKLTARALTSSKSKKGKIKKKAHKVVIGKTSFSIPAGKSKVVGVKLNGAGQLLVGQAGKKGVKAKVSGTGVKASSVVLK